LALGPQLARPRSEPGQALQAIAQDPVQLNPITGRRVRGDVHDGHRKRASTPRGSRREPRADLERDERQEDGGLAADGPGQI
jgi:hypothetical protein